MDRDDRDSLLRNVVAAAVQCLEEQNGMVLPIAQAITAGGRRLWVGTYEAGVRVDVPAAIASIRDTLRRADIRASALLYAVVMPPSEALSIELESLDGRAEHVYIPFVLSRRALRRCRVDLGAATREPATGQIFDAARRQA